MKPTARIGIAFVALISAACAAQAEDDATDQAGAFTSSKQDLPQSVMCQAPAKDRVNSRYIDQVVRLESGSCQQNRIDTYNGSANPTKRFARCEGADDACLGVLCTKPTSKGFIIVSRDGNDCIKQDIATLQGTGTHERIQCGDADRYVNAGCARLLTRQD